MVITRPDFLEKNAIVAGGLPPASSCLLISVTLNVVLLLLFTHFFFPLSSSMPLFVWLPIFHALTQDELSNPLKASIVSVSASQLMSITSRKRKDREEDWSEGEELETFLWGSFDSGRRKVIFMTVTLKR